MLSACNDDVNQFIDAEEDYRIFMILEAGNYLQTGVVSSTYFGNGFDPTYNYENPFVEGVILRLFFSDTVKIFNQGKIFSTLSNSERDTIPVYLNRDCFIKPDEVVEMEAIIGSNRITRSYVHVPDTIKFNNDFTDRIIPVIGKQSISVSWLPDNQDIIFLPKLKIWYIKKGVGEFYKTVPIEYKQIEDTLRAVFPEASSMNFYTYSLNVIERAMHEISEGDPEKSDYIIMRAYWEISSLDENLSAFYSANNDQGSSYDVTLNRTRFNNINGAKGVFGAFTVSEINVRINNDFITSFGYTVGIPY